MTSTTPLNAEQEESILHDILGHQISLDQETDVNLKHISTTIHTEPSSLLETEKTVQLQNNNKNNKESNESTHSASLFTLQLGQHDDSQSEEEEAEEEEKELNKNSLQNQLISGSNNNEKLTLNNEIKLTQTQTFNDSSTKKPDLDSNSTSPVSSSNPMSHNRQPNRPLRYFIVKSLSQENLEISVRKGVWATQRHNEPKFNEAFNVSVFSLFN
jgi:hypothetical protein